MTGPLKVKLILQTWSCLELTSKLFVCSVGEALPSAQVIGVDLSPIQPVWIPPNVEFLVDDIEDNWVHASDFDFAHLRFVGIALKDNMKMFRTIFE